MGSISTIGDTLESFAAQAPIDSNRKNKAIGEIQIMALSNAEQGMDSKEERQEKTRVEAQSITPSDIEPPMGGKKKQRWRRSEIARVGYASEVLTSADHPSTARC